MLGARDGVDKEQHHCYSWQCPNGQEENGKRVYYQLNRCDRLCLFDAISLIALPQRHGFRGDREFTITEPSKIEIKHNYLLSKQR